MRLPHLVAPDVQTASVPSGTHPFPGGGGGTTFEYKVATLLAGDLILSRLNELGGVAVSLGLQLGPDGFDDLEITLELISGGTRKVSTQVRYTQRFTSSDKKFGQLLAHARAAIDADEIAFATGARRLAVIVDRESPGHVSMARLCGLARKANGYGRFVTAVEAHAGQVAARWQHCLDAAKGIGSEKLFRVLGSIEIRAVELRSSTSGDYVSLLNRLAHIWDPPDLTSARNLANALFAHLVDIGSAGGAVDLSSLQADLGSLLPRTMPATNRRAALARRRDAGQQRVIMSLRVIGLHDDEASSLASRILEMPPKIEIQDPFTIVTGPMGVGKTTELERLHRAAIDQAIGDSDAPIPLMIHAREARNNSLESIARSQAPELGDPSRLGVHVIIDGLDEVGIRVGELAGQAATLTATWPRSTVIVATRPESPIPGLPVATVGPLSHEAATELMTSICPGVGRWDHLRSELREVLCRPLFAIRYALDHRSGNHRATTEAQLVASVGAHAIGDADGMANETFDLLVRLACRIVDSGGMPVDPRNLALTPTRIASLARSRVIHVSDGEAWFQLAALTEFFAATALLRDAETLMLSVSTPLRAWRWRYALVQAVLQGSDEDVDRIMSTLLERIPATAAWVYRQALPPHTWDRQSPPAVTAIEAGIRVRRAQRAWISPWPTLVSSWTIDGELPTLGVDMDGSHLVTAVRRSMSAGAKQVVVLPPDAELFRPYKSEWTGAHMGRPIDDALWPWHWTFGQVQSQIDSWIKNRDLLVEVELCWPELSWDYAHLILGRSPSVQSQPVSLVALQDAVDRIRAQFPTGDVQVGSRGGGGGWRLQEAEAFVSDLRRLGIDEIASPWPAANTKGRWVWNWWTTEQLLDRLNLTTKTALDVYRSIVEHHLPGMASELDTFQLLPARIVGTLTPAGSTDAYEDQPRYTWHLVPLPSGSVNEAHWQVGKAREWRGEAEWQEQRKLVRRLRGEGAERITLWNQNGEPGVLSSTPAGTLALSLLAQDLSRFGWTSGHPRYDGNVASARPRFAAHALSTVASPDDPAES